MDMPVCRKRELFRIWKFVSYLELPNKRAGETEDESGVIKVSVDVRNKIWKEHMENLINVENEWSDSTDAIK